MQILTVSGLQKTYTTRFGGSKVQALKNVNFTVESGEYVAIMGESGSGKTTLLNILAALDKPTGGTVLLGGKNLSEIPEETAAAFRRDNLGFVFQDFSLLDTFSLEDNICLPLVLAGKSRTEMRDRLEPQYPEVLARRDARPALTARLRPRHRDAAQKVPLRGLRRTEAARRRRPRTHHPSADPAGRRADRRARLPLDRRALEALRRDQRLWPDHRDGHALCARGELRLARAVPA